MLVEQGADDIVDQLVLPVEHIQGKGGHEGHKADNKQLSQELCEDFKNFFMPIYPQYPDKTLS